MFKQLSQVDAALRFLRLFSLLVLGVFGSLTWFALHINFANTQKAAQRIYVLSGGKVFDATASERKDNIDVEARDHVRTFHSYFFTLDPDDKAIQTSVSKALYLGDRSVKQQYDNLRESNYYAGIISGNVSQRIQIDSVLLQSNDYPIYFRCYATESIVRTSSVVLRNLVTEGRLRFVARSDNNPHGFLIEQWRVLENADVKTTPRK